MLKLGEKKEWYYLAEPCGENSWSPIIGKHGDVIEVDTLQEAVAEMKALKQKMNEGDEDEHVIWIFKNTEEIVAQT